MMTALGLGFLVVVAGVLAYLQLTRTERDHVAAQLSAIADLKAAQIASWRSELLQDAAMFRQMPQLAARVQELSAGRSADAARQELQQWTIAIKAAGRYSEVLIYSVEGDLLAAPPGIVTKPHSSTLLQAFIRQSLDHGGPMLTDPHRPGPDDPIHLDILVPLYAPGAAEGKAGEAIAIVVLRVDAAQTLYPLVNLWPVPSQSAESLIVTPVGDRVLALSDLRFRPNAALNFSMPMKTSDTPAVRAVKGKTGIVEAGDYRGVPVIAAIRAIPGSPWFLVSKIDRAEAYNAVRFHLVALATIVLLLLLSVGLMLSSNLREQHADRLEAEVRERRKAEESAKESEQRLRSYVEQAADALFVHDGEGRMLEVNAQACRMLGYSREELLQLKVSDVDLDFSPEAAREVMRGMQPGTPFTLQSRHRRKDGGILPVEIRFGVLELGGRRLYLAQARDVSERLRADAALRESEQRLRAYLNQGSDAFFVNDATGRLLEVNEEACRVLGYTRNELLQLTVGDVEVDFNPQEIKTKLGSIVPGRPLTTESRHRRKDGSVFPVEVRVGCFDLGAQRFFMAQARDVTVRKQAELEIRDSRERLSVYVDQSSDALFVHDFDGRFLEVNRQACIMHGYEREELLAAPITDIEVGLDLPRVREVLGGLQPGHPITIEGRHRRKDGSEFPVEVRLGCFDLSGQRHYLAQVRDITSRKAAEAELRQSEERLRAYLDQAGDAFFVNDKNGRFIEANREACRQLGYSREELLQMTPADIDTQLSAEQVRELLAGILPGNPVTFESRQRRKDGSLFPVEVRVGCVEHGATRYYIAQSRDITERKQAEAAVRASEERFRGLVESSFDFVWEVDAQGRYTYASPQIQTILGYSPAEVLGRTPFDFMTELEAKRVGTVFLKLIEERKPMVCLENVNRHRNGSNVVLETNGSPIFGPDGSLLGYRGIDRDVTARKRAEQALRDANLRLEYEVAVRTRELAGERARLQSVFDSIPLGVLLVATQANGRITRMVNDAYLRLCGLTRAQAADHAALAKLTHPDDRAAEAERQAEVESGKLNQYTQEKRVVRADGTVLPVLVRFQRRTTSDRTREDLTILTELPPRGGEGG